MSQLDKIEKILSDHVERSTAQHILMSNQLTRLETKGDSEKERMDKHEREIDKLKWWKMATGTSLITSVSHLITNIFK